MAIFMDNKEEYSSANRFTPPAEHYIPSSSTNTQPNQRDNGLITDCIIRIEDLRKEVEILKKRQEKTDAFFSESAKLAKTSRIAIILLMVIPGLQFFACAVIIYLLGIQDQLPSIINWALGIISALSIIEVIFTGLKYFVLENKVDELKEKLEELKNKS